MMASFDVNRRKLLSAGVAIGSVAVSGTTTHARNITGTVPWEPDQAAAPAAALADASPPVSFFTASERAFVDAATSRLIPQDELGGGAKEAGVTIFLDRQLAGSYGKASTWYMQGPWSEGTPSQGNQSRLTPAQTYRAAIKAIDSYCQKTFNKTFAQLAEKQQDEVLTQLEKGDIELEGVKAKSFFEALLQNTLEGFLSDPIYGGNRDMVGWKLIGFPGTRYDYRDYVSKHGERLALAPVGLKINPQD
jgi:gluconate 2-dehydrogenase gamma chain